MIPPFDEHGYLPPGIHPATLDEVEAIVDTGYTASLTLPSALGFA